MAKKNTTEKKDEQQLIVQTMVDAAKSAEKLFIKETNATPKELKKLTDTYSAMKIKDIDDLAGYKFVVQGEKDLKKLRTTIGKVRKTLTAPAISFQKGMIEKEKEILEIIQPLENDLNAKRTDYEDKVQAAKNKLFSDRCTALDKHGYQLNGDFYVCSAINIEADKIADLTNDEFDFYLQKGLEEMERIAAEEKRRKDEADALQKQRDEMDAERKKFAEERAAFEKEKAEMEAQKKALEETYEEVEKPKDEPKVEEKVVVETEKSKEEETNIEAIIRVGKEIGVEATIQHAPEDKKSKSVEEPQIDVGFNEFRKRVIALAGDKNQKLTRPIIIEWAEKQQLWD